MQVLAVIPARYASTRFPGKPLHPIAGKPMIQHVVERVSKAPSVDKVLVATDDERIVDAVQAFGGESVMTNPEAPTGTDRIAEVAQKSDARVILNVQGDEPLIHPDSIEQLAAYLLQAPTVPMASLMRPGNPEQVSDPNVVKVVTNEEGFALYFSRAGIPYDRQQGAAAQNWFQHIGIYGYQREFLLKYTRLAPTMLESTESLEQLRALGHGYSIQMLVTAHESLGVDTPEDVARVEERIRTSESNL